jgi:hypothetical protein
MLGIEGPGRLGVAPTLSPLPPQAAELNTTGGRDNLTPKRESADTPFTHSPRYPTFAPWAAAPT